MATNAIVQAAHRAPKLGKKPIYLPTFKITLLNTPDHPPTFASFIVPLNINKLDMRDYLWNMYNVRCLNVRSYIQQQAVQESRAKAKRPRREIHRPRAVKRMMVEMERGFVWPEIGDLEQWDNKAFHAAEKDREESSRARTPGWRMSPAADRTSIAEQAAEVLRTAKARREKMWDSQAGEIEVEADVDIRKDLEEKK